MSGRNQLACSSQKDGFKTGRYSPVQWAFGADNEEQSFTTTMPSEIETCRMAAMSRHLQEQARCHQSCSTHHSQVNHRAVTWNMGLVFPLGKSDSWCDRGSFQSRSLERTCAYCHERVSSTTERICACHDGAEWCRSDITWKQIDQISRNSASSVQRKRSIDCF